MFQIHFNDGAHWVCFEGDEEGSNYGPFTTASEANSFATQLIQNAL